MKPGLPLSFRERRVVLSRATATLRYMLTALADVRFLRRSPIAYGLSGFALHRPTAFDEADFERLPASEPDLAASRCDPKRREVNLFRVKTKLLQSNGASSIGHSLIECHLPAPFAPAVGQALRSPCLRLTLRLRPTMQWGRRMRSDVTVDLATSPRHR